MSDDPPKSSAGPAADEGIWTKVKEAFSDIRTWSSLFYMLLRFPLGVVYFLIAVVGLYGLDRSTASPRRPPRSWQSRGQLCGQAT